MIINKVIYSPERLTTFIKQLAITPLPLGLTETSLSFVKKNPISSHVYWITLVMCHLAFIARSVKHYI